MAQRYAKSNEKFQFSVAIYGILCGYSNHDFNYLVLLI